MYKNKTFEKNVILAWPDKGLEWLKNLPETIDLAKKYWDLQRICQYPELSYNYVAHAYKDNHEVVLKLGCDDHDIQRELTALKAYNGNGSIRLLDYNLEYNALLLEKAIPVSCKSLFPEDDYGAILIAVDIMEKLHTAVLPQNNFLPSLQDLFKDIYKTDSSANSYHINKARSILDYLFSTQNKQVVLHGDLHHDNILASDRGWLSIDPKGLIGDPGFEICAFVRNPDPKKLKSKELVLHRLDLFSEETEIDRDRLHKWIYVNAVLNACWSIADNKREILKAFAEANLIDSIK